MSPLWCCPSVSAPSHWARCLRLYGLRRGARIANLFGELLFRVLFFGGVLMLPLFSSILHEAVIPGGALTFAIGTAVGWLGLLLRWWSFVTLGRYFTVVLKTSPEQTIVDRGPTRALRHPSYAGLLLALVGAGLMIGNWAGALMSFILVLTAIVYRIHIEERALIASIDTYRVFSNTRARLVPFVW